MKRSKRAIERHQGRGRGRPRHALELPDVRAALLEAARKLFAGRGFHEVSTREIARAAGVNPAMIHYYFDDKEGLYKAMLGDAAERLVSQATEIAVAGAPSRRSEGGAAEAFNGPIPDLLRLYIGTLLHDPWIPRLMIREVLSDGAPFRREFIERFASRAAALIPELVRRERQAGRLRDDLDPVLTTLSLMGMAVFPFLAFPVAREVFGLELNEEFRDRLVAHTTKLFTEGAAAGGVKT
jgi:AcrR family transcriptional regulator